MLLKRLSVELPATAFRAINKFILIFQSIRRLLNRLLDYFLLWVILDSDRLFLNFIGRGPIVDWGFDFLLDLWLD
jgi:hypothetical protein